jgi:hypothetical protein
MLERRASGDAEPGWVVVAATEQDALARGGLVPAETAHHVGADGDVRPTFAVGDRDPEGSADRGEQCLEVDLLDHPLQVDVLVFPKGKRLVVQRPVFQAADNDRCVGV